MKTSALIVLLLSIFGFWYPAGAAQTAAPPAEVQGQRVFTAGHSLLMFVPTILKEIATAANVEGHVQAGKQSVGGSPVIKHWNWPDERNTVKPALKSGAVDVLMLSPIYLPDEGIEKLAELGVHSNRLLQELAWDATKAHPLSGVSPK